MNIERIIKLDIGTSAQSVEVGLRVFLIQNNGAGNIYFREKTVDGADCTALNGFALNAGETLNLPMRAETLSIIGSAAGQDVRIIFFD